MAKFDILGVVEEFKVKSGVVSMRLNSEANKDFISFLTENCNEEIHVTMESSQLELPGIAPEALETHEPEPEPEQPKRRTRKAKKEKPAPEPEPEPEEESDEPEGVYDDDDDGEEEDYTDDDFDINVEDN